LGTVFKLAPGGTATVLHAFSLSGGYNTLGYLLRDAAGNLYGTTAETDSVFDGSVFKIAPDGTFTKFHQFGGDGDGVIPAGTLAMGAGGAIYGTTAFGGANGSGVLFKLTPRGKETILRDFDAGEGSPAGGLTADAAGNLFGTTNGGGGADCRHCGELFELTRAGKYKILHGFENDDGWAPNAPLTLDPLGNLIGATAFGGDDEYGVVYRLER
jgi:uncharacterized repeat protein (TIGR03803 family)